MSNRNGRWGDITWMLAVSAQGGLMVALPVVLGLAVGYALDRYLDTLPWITLALTLLGAISGPVLLYRWATAMVGQRREERERQDEESS